MLLMGYIYTSCNYIHLGRSLAHNLLANDRPQHPPCWRERLLPGSRVDSIGLYSTSTCYSPVEEQGLAQQDRELRQPYLGTLLLWYHRQLSHSTLRPRSKISRYEHSFATREPIQSTHWLRIPSYTCLSFEQALERRQDYGSLHTDFL